LWCELESLRLAPVDAIVVIKETINIRPFYLYYTICVVLCYVMLIILIYVIYVLFIYVIYAVAWHKLGVWMLSY